MNQFSNVCLDSIGYVLPPRVVSSLAIEQRLAPLYSRLKLAEGRLELMSGISERRFWPAGTRPSQAATFAGLDVLAKTALSPQDIDCLIFTSVSRDMMEPATASFVHKALGLAPSCLIFDLSNACLGFLDGMLLLAGMIELGQIRNGMIVSGETAEELHESTLEALISNPAITRKSFKPAFASLTIGSGSVAAILRRAAETETVPRLVHAAWRANTDHSDLCQGDHTGAATTLMETDSEALLLQGVETAYATWQVFAAHPQWRSTNIDCFCCHQVGSAHARLLFERLGLDQQKNFQTLAALGNVGSVSAPITMAMAIEQAAFKQGQKAALLGIGSGINCLMLGMDWS